MVLLPLLLLFSLATSVGEVERCVIDSFTTNLHTPLSYLSDEDKIAAFNVGHWHCLLTRLLMLMMKIVIT